MKRKNTYNKTFEQREERENREFVRKMAAQYRRIQRKQYDLYPDYCKRWAETNDIG